MSPLPFFQKYKAATLGGQSPSVKKEIQRYHVVNQFFADSEMYKILSDCDFFATVDRPCPPLFQSPEKSPAMQPTVEIEELSTEAIPTALLSIEALETIHEMRHQRYLNRMEGNFHLGIHPILF